MMFLSNFIYNIFKGWSRVLRWPRTRGFGVQSPWAYNYLRSVIAEHTTYYAYDQLAQRYGMLSSVDRNLAQFYLRIANRSQPHRWCFAIDSYGMKADYVRSGCMSTVIEDTRCGYVANKVSACNVLVMTLGSNWRSIFESFATSSNATSILIIEDIHRTRHSLKIWKTIRDDERCGITFDLYDCGLVFFDRSKHKQHYAVNY
jgi:hypothetical protein